MRLYNLLGFTKKRKQRKTPKPKRKHTRKPRSQMPRLRMPGLRMPAPVSKTNNRPLRSLIPRPPNKGQYADPEPARPAPPEPAPAPEPSRPAPEPAPPAPPEPAPPPEPAFNIPKLIEKMGNGTLSNAENAELEKMGLKIPNNNAKALKNNVLKNAAK